MQGVSGVQSPPGAEGSEGVRRALTALTALAAGDEQALARLFLHETATALGVSPATVTREWTVARAWRIREMSA